MIPIVLPRAKDCRDGQRHDAKCAGAGALSGTNEKPQSKNAEAEVSPMVQTSRLIFPPMTSQVKAQNGFMTKQKADRTGTRPGNRRGFSS
jgi:hypothetical protein